MRNNQDNDLFDRAFFGKPGCMIIVVIAVVIFFTLKHYF